MRSAVSQYRGVLPEERPTHAPTQPRRRRPLPIDDFGTGYSSLAYLRRFPIDELKIDRSFVTGLDTDTYDATLVAAMIGIGDALGHRVVAEGVETTEELAALRDLGCQYAQGYLFARPCTFDECVEFLDDGRPGPR